MIRLLPISLFFSAMTVLLAESTSLLSLTTSADFSGLSWVGQGFIPQVVDCPVVDFNGRRAISMDCLSSTVGFVLKNPVPQRVVGLRFHLYLPPEFPDREFVFSYSVHPEIVNNKKETTKNLIPVFRTSTNRKSGENEQNVRQSRQISH